MTLLFLWQLTHKAPLTFVTLTLKQLFSIIAHSLPVNSTDPTYFIKNERRPLVDT